MEYTVYGLIDPRSQSMFYIGITRNSAKSRLSAHCTDPASRAWRTCRAIIATGAKPTYVVLSEGLDKEGAKLLESRLIYLLDGVVNDRLYGGISISELKHPKWKNLDYAVAQTEGEAR